MQGSEMLKGIHRQRDRANKRGIKIERREYCYEIYGESRVREISEAVEYS